MCRVIPNRDLKSHLCVSFLIFVSNHPTKSEFDFDFENRFVYHDFDLL